MTEATTADLMQAATLMKDETGPDRVDLAFVENKSKLLLPGTLHIKNEASSLRRILE